MTKDHFTHDGEYIGPERRIEYPQKRRMVLTDGDIDGIAARVAELHICRYTVNPEEMAAVVHFVQSVKTNVEDYRKGVRKSVIKILVWSTIAGALYLVAQKVPFLRPVLRYLTGGVGP